MVSNTVSWRKLGLMYSRLLLGWEECGARVVWCVWVTGYYSNPLWLAWTALPPAACCVK